MQGYFCLVLHAHLPFVRHPEHERSLEETWLFEALIETYIPLLQLMERWQDDRIRAPLTLTLSPTLCAMLSDPLLQARFSKHLDALIELAEREAHRTIWEKAFHELAVFYLDRLNRVRTCYYAADGNLLNSFRKLQEAGALEIITTAATHAVLPLLMSHSPSVRAQILVARDSYRSFFGVYPQGIWLPECAYTEGIEPILREACLRWFVTDTHGVLNARPKPRFGTFAPIVTPHGLAAFGRDHTSARQVWSRAEGYPGDPRYRDFYRDIGFDLDLDYLGPSLPAPGKRTFTGIKYYRVTGDTPAKAPYERPAALHAADEHATHFLKGRVQQIERAAEILARPPLVLAPYDAELFGHWWYEGLEFLDFFIRKAFYDQTAFVFTTPGEFLNAHPSHQLAVPAASSWGQDGYWRMWLNEKTEWIYPHLAVAQERMSELAARPTTTVPPLSNPEIIQRATAQAGRELLLAQASDWPFILRTGTSPDYARHRLRTHLARFNRLYEQIASGAIEPGWLASVESTDNLFPAINPHYWEKRAKPRN